MMSCHVILFLLDQAEGCWMLLSVFSVSAQQRWFSGSDGGMECTLAQGLGVKSFPGLDVCLIQHTTSPPGLDGLQMPNGEDNILFSQKYKG